MEINSNWGFGRSRERRFVCFTTWFISQKARAFLSTPIMGPKWHVLDVSRCVHHIHPSLLWDACHEYDSYHGYSTFRDETGAKSMEPDQRGVGTWMKRCATSLRESSTSALRPSLSWIPRDIGPGALPHLSSVCFMSRRRQTCCSIMK